MKPTPSPGLIRLPAVLLAGSLALSLPLQAGNLPASNYTTDWNAAAKIAADLHGALEDKEQSRVVSGLVRIQVAGEPRLRSILHEGQPAVGLSPECLEFLSRFSHALAIETVSPGTLASYRERLEAMQPGQALPELPAPPGDAAWSLDVMNAQVSQFNQMIGALVAIKMSHHYLGQYAKHKKEMQSSPDTALHAVLSEKEFREAMIEGSKNALRCGLGVGGLQALLESLDQMPRRPAWTYDLLPKDSNPSKLSKDLRKLDSFFFIADY